MKRYIGTKIILAEPMDEITFITKFRALPEATLVNPSGETRPGYRVMYEDGYVSWSPAEAFERAYRLISDGECRLLGFTGMVTGQFDQEGPK